MRLAVPAFCAVLLAGCAGMDAAECRSANWYEVGYRDAIFSLQPQDGIYEAQCTRQGEKVDLASYSHGWREGKWEADSRRNESTD